MSWTRRGPYVLEHASGCRICKARCGDQWHYSAWGPDRTTGWSYRAWRNVKIPHWSGQEPKARYALGEPIPQPRDLLGVFSTAAEAKAKCEESDSKVEKRDAGVDGAGIASPTGIRGASK